MDIDHAVVMDFVEWLWGMINPHDITKILLNLACVLATVNVFVRMGKQIKAEDEELEAITVGDENNG